jgi:hypothetical protein
LALPLTRAGIIEKLVKGGFVERKGKSLVSTKDGNNLVCILPEQIASPSMTAQWENTLMQIERGQAEADVFLADIAKMTVEMVNAYPFLSEAGPTGLTLAGSASANARAAVRRSMWARATFIVPTATVPSVCGRTISFLHPRKEADQEDCQGAA